MDSNAMFGYVAEINNQVFSLKNSSCYPDQFRSSMDENQMENSSINNPDDATSNLDMCHIVSSKRGKDKILNNNFLYQFERVSKDGLTKWRCDKRKKELCSGSIKTKLIGGYHIKVSEQGHCHFGSPSSIIRQKFINQVKESASSSNDPPSKIHQYYFSNLTEDEAFFVPSKEATRQMVKRLRKDELPAEPADVMDYSVPELFKDFCLLEKTSESERVLVFGLKEHIKILCQSPIILMDGTFYIVSRLFRQLYSIHVQVTPQANPNFIAPIIFVLMTSKSAESYRMLFSMLNELAEAENLELKPQILLTDFELAVVKVVPEFWPEASHKTCYFHFSQCIERNVSTLGLSGIVSRSLEDQLRYKMLRSLAFVPTNEVKQAFEHLKADFPPEYKPILDYLDTYYINGTSNSTNDRRIRVSQPRFPPSLWNVHDNFLIGMERTTNKVESWHRRMKVIIGRKSVNVNILIKHLKFEANVVKNNIANASAGSMPSQSNNTHERKVQQLKFVVENKENGSIFDYLKNVAKNV